MRVISNLTNIFRIFKLIIKYPALFKLTSQIFDTLNKVADEKRALTQNIVIDFKTDLIPPIILNMWIAVGENANPVRRIQELVKENNELKQKIN